MPQATSLGDPLFVTNRLIDVIFILDMTFNFFLMYEKKSYEDGMAISQWEVRLDRIARRYVTSPYFVIDVCSIVPSAFDVYTTAVIARSSNADGSQVDGTLSALKSLRIMRVLRLIKVSDPRADRIRSEPVVRVMIMSLP